MRFFLAATIVAMVCGWASPGLAQSFDFSRHFRPMPVWQAASMESERGEHEHGGHDMKQMRDAESDSCAANVPFDKAAESKPGGANYSGPTIRHHGEYAKEMPEMKGAHMDHQARHGGVFFMAPNKMHHLEGVYSERCGFRLFFYNAFTELIRVNRFHAFVHITPESEDEPESHRFLLPDKDAKVLQADLGDELSRPFAIKALVKFPGVDEPELFNFNIPAQAVPAADL